MKDRSNSIPIDSIDSSSVVWLAGCQRDERERDFLLKMGSPKRSGGRSTWIKFLSEKNTYGSSVFSRRYEKVLPKKARKAKP